MRIATERQAFPRFRTASAMQRALVTGAVGATLLATPTDALDVIPHEFAAHAFEKRVRIVMDRSERGIDYAALPRSGVVARRSDELLAANPRADTHYAISVDGFTFELSVPGAREDGAAARPRPPVAKPHPRREAAADPALLDEMLDVAMHVSVGVPDDDASASDLRVPDVPRFTPLPEGGGLAMLTSGVAAIALMQRRRRTVRRVDSARDAYAGDPDHDVCAEAGFLVAD